MSAARPLLATGWPIVATRARVRRSGTRTARVTRRRPGSRPRIASDVWTHRDGSGKLERHRGRRRSRHRTPGLRRARAPQSDPHRDDREARHMGDKANAHPGAAGRATAADQPRVRTECGAGRPQRIGKDDAGRGPRADRGSGQPGGPGRGRRHRLRLRRDRAPAATLRTALPGPRRMGRASRSICWTPPDTPTSSGSSGPVCERRTRPFSSSRRRRTAMARGSTRMVWEECAAVGMPRAIVVTHLEAARADFEEMTRRLRGDLRRRRPRRRTAAVPAAARRPRARRARAGDRPDRAAVAEGVRLLLRRAQGDRARTRTSCR